MRELPARSPLATHWTLDPDVVFLNHGSFGACPRAVLDAQGELRARMEREPVRFLARELEGLLDAARADLATFVGARPEDLAFVPNATTGVANVLSSLTLAPGDELVTTDHAYNAVRNAMDRVAANARAKVVVAAIPFPLAREEEVAERVRACLNERTRLVVIDHVTSPTAIVFPVAEIVRACAARGIDVLVDGAHAPGMLPLDLAAIGAAYYTGNLHKWVCAPKGAAFLHVRRDRQEMIRPAITSHGANSPRSDRSRFQLELDWTGTQDPTAALCVPVALRTLASLVPGGWPEVRARNRALALTARDILAAKLSVAPPVPDSMLGSMAALPLPPDPTAPPPTSPLYTDPLQARLFDDHAIEVPIIPWPALATRLVRISAHLYNTPAAYEYLSRAL